MDTRQVFRQGKEIRLSGKEFSLLRYMVQNSGIVLSREKLEQHIWNYDYTGGSNVIDVYIRYLRKKLDEPFAEEEYAICVAKGNDELVTAINGALAQLKEDGTLDSIVSNYIGDDTKGQSPYESPADVDRSNGTLVMATNAYFEPYEYYDGDKIVGIDADMAQAVCDVLGYELVIEDMEFDAIINAIQSGKADIGVAGITVTEDRQQSVDFTDSYATSKQVIIVKE